MIDTDGWTQMESMQKPFVGARWARNECFFSVKRSKWNFWVGRTIEFESRSISFSADFPSKNFVMLKLNI